MLEHNNWQSIYATYNRANPQFIVLDDFLPLTVAEELHNELASHALWRFKNTISKHLHNANPRGACIDKVVTNIKQKIATYWAKEELRLIDY